MLHRLVEFALTQRAFILILSVVIAGLGTYALLNIPIDAFPNIASVQAKIIMKAPGMTPYVIQAAPAAAAPKAAATTTPKAIPNNASASLRKIGI